MAVEKKTAKLNQKKSRPVKVKPDETTELKEPVLSEHQESALPSEAIPTPKKQKHVFLWVGIGVIVLLTSSTVYLFIQYQKTVKLLKPQESSELTVSEVAHRVGSLMLLPHETPTLARVSDITKLSGQPFFTNAQNGDDVLIYSLAKEAILYRPSINKLIAVAPLSIPVAGSGPQVAGAESSASPSAIPTESLAPFTVSLYNGTNVVGLTHKVEQTIKPLLPMVTVVSRGDTRGNYTSSIVVDLTGTMPEAAKKLAQVVHATVEALPTGEAKPKNADILLIIGKDNSQ